LGIGDWGLGIGDLGFGPIPQTQKPKTKNPICKKNFFCLGGVGVGGGVGGGGWWGSAPPPQPHTPQSPIPNPHSLYKFVKYIGNTLFYLNKNNN